METSKIYRQNEDGTFTYFGNDEEVTYANLEEFIVCLHNNKLQAQETVEFLSKR